MEKILKFTFLILITIVSTNCTNNDTTELDMENQLLNLIEKSDLKNNALFVYDFNNDTINYNIKDGWETGWSDEELFSKSSELCRGSGLSFAKCVKKAVDGGTCVTVYKEGGDYVAVKTKCPNSIAPAN